MYGDPSSPPTLKATANFQGFGLIDGNPYWSENPNWVTTNVFYRQVRNFILDTTAIAPGTAATGMHWPTSQATSLQNVVFNMPKGNGVVHVGLFIESGTKHPSLPRASWTSCLTEYAVQGQEVLCRI